MPFSLKISTPGPNMPDEHGRQVVGVFHHEYTKYHLLWQWLQDSLEGGENYKNADYGVESYPVQYTVQLVSGDVTGHTKNIDLPRRNLIRHPQEYPQSFHDLSSPSFAEGAASTSDEYAFRRALTPVPSFVSEAVESHLARIYAREVRREAPPGPEGDAVRAWWLDVDGRGTSIDDWMQETVAPLFVTLGQIDIAFDHPPAPEHEPVRSRADAERLGLTDCVATIVLPENLVNWKLHARGGYSLAVVREIGDDGTICFREWTCTDWTLYDEDGRILGHDDHPYECVPIFRAFDRKKHRTDNVGQSRYEAIAEIQRAAYNVESELTLNNSLQAHPILSGPEELCTSNTIQVGPGNILPKRMSGDNGTYEGWEYVSPKNDPAEKLEKRLLNYRDAADRAACLSKPAGASHKGTVGQSGISKMLDQVAGNDLLGRIGRALERLERKAIEKVVAVQADGKASADLIAKIKIVYPTRFDLFTPGDFAALIADFQSLAASADGEIPETTGLMLRTYVRLAMPNLDDAIYKKLDGEIDDFVARRKAYADQIAEGPPVRNQAQVSFAARPADEMIEDAPTGIDV